jgi:hypothetical protein
VLLAVTKSAGVFVFAGSRKVPLLATGSTEFASVRPIAFAGRVFITPAPGTPLWFHSLLDGAADGSHPDLAFLKDCIGCFFAYTLINEIIFISKTTLLHV